MRHFHTHPSSLLVFVILLTLSIHKPQASVKDFVHLDRFSPESLYNDYTEARYDEVLDRFIKVMQRYVSARDGSLHIQRDWGDGAVNAWAWRLGNEYWLEVPGGAARYHLLNEEAFLATLCHELGHLLGGAPAGAFGISYEGQADYYSASKCLRILLAEIEPFKEIEETAEIKQRCATWNSTKARELCGRSLIGALSVTSYYAELEGAPPPKLSTPSQKKVAKTKKAHPDSQCRLDTYVAGALCPLSEMEDISYADPDIGFCNKLVHPEYQRPACWYFQP